MKEQEAKVINAAPNAIHFVILRFCLNSFLLTQLKVWKRTNEPFAQQRDLHSSEN